jgi:hypothetical protein
MVTVSGLSPMDIQETILVLKIERDKVVRAIAALEEYLLTGGDPAQLPKRRGRKSMPPEERAEVSERMRKYWAKRRRPPE